MNDYCGNGSIQNEREKELHKLIEWTQKNPSDWRRICNPESYVVTVKYISELVEKLYEEQFFTLIYIVIHTNWTVREVEMAINRTQTECLLDIPLSTLIDRFRQNLKIMAEESRKREKVLCAMPIQSEE